MVENLYLRLPDEQKPGPNGEINPAPTLQPPFSADCSTSSKFIDLDGSAGV